MRQFILAIFLLSFAQESLSIPSWTGGQGLTEVQTQQERQPSNQEISRTFVLFSQSAQDDFLTNLLSSVNTIALVHSKLYDIGLANSGTESNQAPSEDLLKLMLTTPKKGELAPSNILYIVLPKNIYRPTEGLFGSYLDLELLNSSTLTASVITTDDFLELTGFKSVFSRWEHDRREPLCFPPMSGEYYSTVFGVKETGLDFEVCDKKLLLASIPSDVDTERFGVRCNEIQYNSIQVPAGGSNSVDKVILLDWIFEYTFCAEHYLQPHWKDAFAFINPESVYRKIAGSILSKAKFETQALGPNGPRKFVFVHLRQFNVNENEGDHQSRVINYAQQVMRTLRKQECLYDTIFISSGFGRTLQPSEDLQALVAHLKKELDHVIDCSDLDICFPWDAEKLGKLQPASSFSDLLEDPSQLDLINTLSGNNAFEMALGIQADYFVGNVYSTLSKSIALIRQRFGKPYNILRGFKDIHRLNVWGLDVEG